MIKIHKFLAALAICGFLFTTSKLSFAFEREERPFRTGIISLNREIDQIKPLAESDNGGFIMRGDTIIGSFDFNFIRAYNLESRKNLWWHKIDGEITAPPVLIENSLYFSTRSGHLSAINALTGEKIWDTQIDSYCERPLTWSNGILYIVSAGQVAYAIDASSGKRLWVHDAGFPDMLVVRRPPAPVIHDGRMIIGLATGELLALKIEDGKKIWRYNPFYQESRFKDIIGEMVVHNGKLLLTRYDGLVALVDISQERQVIWQDRQTSISTSSFRAGRFYAALTNGEIIAYDATTGRVNWRTQAGFTASFMVASETNLYVIGNNGRISALEIGSGKYNWGDDLGNRIATAPIITGDKMFVATGYRNLYGYKIQ